jgi:hypothetical protein
MVQTVLKQSKPLFIGMVASLLLMVVTVMLASSVSNRFMREQIAYQRNFLLAEPAIDGWTTCISLLAFAGEPEQRSVLYRASMVALPVEIDQAPCDELTKWIDAESSRDINSTTYARYWFGGSAVLRLLSTFTAGLEATRTLIAALWVIGLALYFSLACQRFGVISCLLLLGAPLLTTDFLSALKAPHVALSFFVSLVVGIVTMASSRSHTNVILFLFGFWLPFFDPLTHPVFYFYIAVAPVVLSLFKSHESATVVARTSLLLGVHWVLGYALSWMMKWSFAGLFGDGLVVFRDSFSQVLFRASGDVDGKPLGFLDGLNANVSEFVDRPFATTLVAVTVLYSLVSILIRLRRDVPIDFEGVVLSFIIGLAPQATFVLLKSHSFEHSWMTYRSIAIAIGLSLACLYLRDDRLFFRGAEQIGSKERNA